LPLEKRTKLAFLTMIVGLMFQIHGIIAVYHTAMAGNSMGGDLSLRNKLEGKKEQSRIGKVCS
jgi:uncharacterized membrane protein